MLIFRNIQPEQQFTGPGFGGIPVQFGKLHFQVGHRHAVFLAHFRQRVDAISFGLHLPQLFVAHDDRIQYRAVFVGVLILAQLTQPLVRVHHHLAG